MKRWSRVSVAGLACFLLLVSCQTTGKRATEQVEIPIDKEPVSVGILEEEITQIADEYEADGILTHATVVFDGSDQIDSRLGTIYYTFCHQDEKSDVGVTVVVTYDMKQRMVTEVSREEGKGSFDEELTKPIFEGKGVLFTELLDQLNNISSFSGKMDKSSSTLTIEYTSTAIIPEIT